jgi:UDP-N-acetylmuramoylalanine-D-glutamate ligase
MPRLGKLSLSCPSSYLDSKNNTRYILAGVKFSLNSSVDLQSPKLATLMALFSDHMVYINDLASYDKEKLAYDTGEAKLLANVVEMIQQLLSLPDCRRGKAVAYGLQLRVERDIFDEIKRLKDQLEPEEWRYIYACLDMSSGHCLVSHMLRRYGGEQRRLNQPLVR